VVGAFYEDISVLQYPGAAASAVILTVVEVIRHFSLLDIAQQGIEIGYRCQAAGWTIEHCKSDYVAWMKANHRPEGTDR
jgi:hypothetical protein